MSNLEFKSTPMIYAPIAKSVRVESIVVSGVELCIGPCFATIDTGAYHFHGPSDDVKELNR